MERETRPEQPSIATIVPRSVKQLRTLIESQYRDEPTLKEFKVSGTQDSVFPDDFQLRAHVSDNPALQRYVALPKAARDSDLYIWDPLTAYWHSEYRVGGRPVDFRCNYIIHLAPADASHTTVEVIEYLPEIRAGRKWFFLGHSGPGFYDDIRTVAPTASDRTRVLDWIQRAAR